MVQLVSVIIPEEQFNGCNIEYVLNDDKATKDIPTGDWSYIAVKHSNGKLFVGKGRGKISNKEYSVRNVPLLIHRKSGAVYNSDPTWLIRMKGITVLPIGIVGLIVIRTIFHTVMTALNLLIIQPVGILRGRVTLADAAKTTLRSFIDIFRPAIYGSGMLVCSVGMFFMPKTFKHCYGNLERSLNWRDSTFFKKKHLSIMHKAYLPCMNRIATFDSASVALIRDEGLYDVDIMRKLAYTPIKKLS